MESIFMNTENSKTIEPDEFVLNLSQRSDLRSSNKHGLLQNLSIYYPWKNITQQHKNNKPKIIRPTWNDEFELPEGSYSVSDSEDYIKYIIKKNETLPTNPSIHNRLVFKKIWM